MNLVVIVVAVVLIVVLAAVFVALRRRPHDGVDSFRRQIDALSRQARRPVVDQVQSAKTGDEAADAAADVDDEGEQNGT